MRYAGIIGLLGFALVAGATSAAALEGTDDVVRLLEADIPEEVILREIESTGATFVLGVDALIALREAGASDTLLTFLSLRDATPPPGTTVAPAPPGAEPYRIYRRVGADGRERIVLTNLDEDGVPLPLPDPGPGAASPAVARAEPAGDDAWPAAADPRARPTTPPVVVVPVVNVEVPPPPAPRPQPQPQPAYFYPFGGLPGGIVGAYSYPDPHFFLGHGPGVKVSRYPSSFGNPALDLPKR